MHLVTFIIFGIAYIPISAITRALVKIVSLNSGTILDILRYYPAVLVCRVVLCRHNNHIALSFSIFQRLDLRKFFEVHKFEIKQIKAN